MNRRTLLALAIVLLPAALGACASGGGGAGGANRDLLTEADLEPYLAQDVYQAVRRLRSTWFNARGTQGTPTATTDPEHVGVSRADDAGAAQVQVYIDGTRAMTGLDALRDLSVQLVQEIRHLNSRDATMMYGIDHGAGAIMVTTKH